ncbi:MAG TPA: hypothetical protein VJ436_00210, partial [Anaerolineales bacterium]|nr:hypothetical protein [Anaerolineales bacterium]
NGLFIILPRTLANMNAWPQTRRVDPQIVETTPGEVRFVQDVGEEAHGLNGDSAVKRDLRLDERAVQEYAVGARG